MVILIEKWFERKISLKRIEKYCKQLKIKKRRVSEDRAEERRRKQYTRYEEANAPLH